ncbi:hypothetical protein CRUP_025921 [Coryphaenoides rupestris]|nr:hypothetical protein CRUP_025921 [Coryphaenoides rupestris]
MPFLGVDSRVIATVFLGLWSCEQMVKAIQVLRIHLLELEKELIQTSSSSSPSMTSVSSSVNPSGVLVPASSLQQGNVAMTTINSQVVHPLFPLLALLFEKCEQATQGSECITSASFDVDIENFVHQQEQDHKPFFSEDPELDNLELIQTSSSSSPSMTSVSSSVNPSGVLVPASSLQQGNVAMTTINSQVVSGGTLYQPVAMVNLDLSSLLDSEDKKSKNKRGVLPKHATNIMRSWLFQHLMHPYPTEDEKRQIAGQTNLTLLQVNNCNPDPAPKAKKMKSQHRPTQRFWPDSIVAGVLQTYRSQAGAHGNTQTPIEEFTPTPAFPALQYLESVDEGGGGNSLMVKVVMVTRNPDMEEGSRKKTCPF